MPRIGRKVFQEFPKTNTSAPTVRLHISRVVLAVIAYREWDLRAMGVSGAFSMEALLRRDAYAKLPDGVAKGNISRGLLKPLCGLGTVRKDGCVTIRDFLANECGG